MMSKTHIAVGIAASLVVMQPSTIADCLAAVVGGAIGGDLPDIDVRSNSYCRDALYGLQKQPDANPHCPQDSLKLTQGLPVPIASMNMSSDLGCVVLCQCLIGHLF